MSRFRRRRVRGAPIVAESAVNEYMQRDLDSYNWVKRTRRADLLHGINGFKFGTDPFLHQLQCFNIGMVEPRFLFLLKMGAGKSKLVLDLIRWRRKHSGVRRALIVVPREVIVQSWLDQIAEHAPDLTTTVLLGTKAEREEALQQESDLYLVNYPGLAVYMTELVAQGKKGRRKRVITPQAAKRFAQHFDLVVLDESHKIGNHEALVYRECRWFTKYCPYLYALTGTPFGRDPIKLWSQFHVVDNGETLGKSLGMFRAAFFLPETNRFSGGVDYHFNPRMEGKLHRVLQHRSIYYDDKEFADLPPVHRIRRRVGFSERAEEQYQNVLKRLRDSRGAVDELRNAFVRMRMITSGFLSVKSELDERLVLQFDENPKLDALEDMLFDLPEDSKCIIYHDYIVTGKLIRAMLTRNKLKHAELNGQTHDQSGQIKSFLHDPDVRFLVANNESGSTGINPQKVANYAIFFESPVSPITRQQAEKRMVRTGQTKHVHLYDLVVPDSIDEKILWFLKQGRDIFEAVCAGKKKVLL